MDITEFAAVPAITAIVYLAAYFIKTVSASGKANSILPPVCGIMGLILGLVCYFALPGYLSADNWVTAAAIGAVSGFAATGINQIYRQAVKAANTEHEGEDSSYEEHT